MKFGDQQKITIGRSPQALPPQALGKVAAKIVLAKMRQLALQVDPDLAAHVAPSTAERPILREATAGIGIGHAIEEPPMEMRVPIVPRPVRFGSISGNRLSCGSSAATPERSSLSRRCAAKTSASLAALLVWKAGAPRSRKTV